jgi:glycosyltransferase involved in cell wall biosynthesis
MISVCVPVFNVDVRPLARQLASQIRDLEVPAEVLFFDDFSEESFRIINRQIRELDGITYSEMDFNRGRAAIRNQLGKFASHKWLLFLDADSLLPDSGFLKNYICAIGDAQIICGGTTYPANPPEEKTTLLRWKYGIHREQLSAEKRLKQKGFAITSNNFLIRRELFLQTRFREEIREYGHEDTVLGYDLFLKGIKVKHIDNPVVHTGLETSEEYLRKTKSAVRNLLIIKNKLIPDPRFVHASGLLRKLERLEIFKLKSLVAVMFHLSEPFLKRNLTGPAPSLFLFDIYRLGYLCRIRI